MATLAGNPSGPRPSIHADSSAQVERRIVGPLTLTCRIRHSPPNRRKASSSFGSTSVAVERR